MKIDYLACADGSLVPANEDAQDVAMNKLKTGEYYLADIKLNHNYPLLQKVHVFAKFCAQHYFGDIEVTTVQKEWMRGKLTLFAGYYDQVFLRDGGGFELVPKSISYDKMTEEDRRDFYSAMIDGALKHVFAGCDDPNIENQLMGFF